MKNTYLTILIFFFSIFLTKSISAAGPLSPMPYIMFDFYEEGLNILCNGGTINVNPLILGDNGPYTYVWKNSAGNVVSTNLSLTSALADSYTLTLYKNGNNSSWNLTLTESSPINITLVKSVFTGGYNVSYAGGHDGQSIVLFREEFHRIIINGLMEILLEL